MDMQFNNLKIFDSQQYKICKSSDYNFIFNKKTGFFVRWGKTLEDDPNYGPSPEILDIETDSGECLGNCKFCYKCNGKGAESHNMSLDQFKTILDKMPKVLTQLAIGITNIYSNPDFFAIMEYARESDFIPNYTTHGLDLDDKAVQRTSELCGAVAVSVVNKEKTYNAVKKFTDAGMTQCNIHYMLSEETYNRAFKIIDDIKSDNRLQKMNAIVFLQYKPKGKNPDQFHAISDPSKYKKLVDYCLKKDIAFGFDSCSAPLFMTSIADIDEDEKKQQFLSMAEPCEAFGMFSSYINCKGYYYPCSFCEGESDWEDGLDVLNCNDFMKDIWFNEKVNKWRQIILQSSQKCDCEFKPICRSCPIFSITSCKEGNQL